jgi:hypothetical protein
MTRSTSSAPFCTSVFLLLVAAASTAGAARQVHTNEVTVAATDATAAYQEAMRAALVRTTGRRDADQDPAFAELLADARRYVQIYRPPANGSPGQVTLDGAAIERAIVAAGGRIWSSERPVTLVVISGPDADSAGLRRSLEEVGEQRGLPLAFATPQALGLADGAGSSEAALAAARRSGGDVLLWGRLDPGGRWQWTFHSGRGAREYGGAATAGLQAAADELASTSDVLAQQPEMEALVQVNGVADLRDYAQVGALLAGAQGVRSASLIEVSGATATFRVVARGGPEGLAAAFANNAALTAMEGGRGRLVYQYRP